MVFFQSVRKLFFVLLYQNVWIFEGKKLFVKKAFCFPCVRVEDEEKCNFFGRGMALPGFPLFPSTPGKHRDQEAPDAPPGLRL